MPLTIRVARYAYVCTQFRPMLTSQQGIMIYTSGSNSGGVRKVWGDA